MKKVLSLLLSMMILLSCFAVMAVSVNAATKPVPGYYVIGTMTDWTLDKDYLMQKSYFGNHYELLQIPLNEGDELKVVYSDDGVRKTTWYPSGVDNNFIVQETNQYYNIELAPDYDEFAEEWYEGCIKVQPCPPPIDEPDPTVPEPVNHTKELWERGADLTAADLEDAVNEAFNSLEWIYADEITIYNSYRFTCTSAYVVDYNVKYYGYYGCVILEELLGDYLLYSTSSYEPSLFVDDKLYTLTKAYQAGLLTSEMLEELVEADYQGGAFGLGGCRIITRYIKGDADGDGECNIIDATMIQRHEANIATSAFYKPLADVDGDSNVSIIDATLIQRKEAGLHIAYEIG